ncbi:DUF6332 family protein [Streptomyces sp. NPDC014882]|uniref:DUF6332 family protein n=1 Tax=Streptomyces sp. NPDC014882 TaxID=3364927 RepID=UPI003701D8CB
MTGHGGRRTQAERDAITVEIGYALFSAAFAAAVLFGAVAGPALLFELPDALEKVLLRAGLGVAPVVFLVRVASVLVRFRAQATTASTDAASGRSGDGDGDGAIERRGGRPGQPAQPSQPGLTNPDS